MVWLTRSQFASLLWLSLDSWGFVPEDPSVFGSPSPFFGLPCVLLSFTRPAQHCTHVLVWHFRQSSWQTKKKQHKARRNWNTCFEFVKNSDYNQIKSFSNQVFQNKADALPGRMYISVTHDAACVDASKGQKNKSYVTSEFPAPSVEMGPHSYLTHQFLNLLTLSTWNVNSSWVSVGLLFMMGNETHYSGMLK